MQSVTNCNKVRVTLNGRTQSRATGYKESMKEQIKWKSVTRATAGTISHDGKKR